MELFIDSADIGEIKAVLDEGILDGVTTNPSLIKKATEKHSKGKNSLDLDSYLRKILRLCQGKPVSLEVIGNSYTDMVREGKKLYEMYNSIGKNVYVKIPVNPCMDDVCTKSTDGIRAISTLTKSGIPVNATLIFTPEQALLASKAGASFVSPFMGREDDFIREQHQIKFSKEDYYPKVGKTVKGKVIDDNGILSGVDLVDKCVQVLKNNPSRTKVLAASIRSVRQFREAELVGADIATIPYSVIQKLLTHPKTSAGMKKFTEDIVPEYARLLEDASQSKKSKSIPRISKHFHSEIMDSISVSSLPFLDTCVLGALELFNSEKIPQLKHSFKRPLVVGSGNAEATGRIIFNDSDAVFANESDFKSKLSSIPAIDGVVLISASGAKHAPIIAKFAKQKKKKVFLVTNTNDSPASKYSDKVFLFPKQTEPYTYNTSTYMGMILGKTGEDPKKIYDFISSKVSTIDFSKTSNYEKFFLILPSKYGVGIKRMVEVKFIELFARQLSRDVETTEYMKHAVTVVPSNELFISFGEKNNLWGNKNDRLHIPLPKWADYGCMMAVAYYVVGQIQRSHPQYFKESITRYTKKISKVFKSKISPIVR